MMGPAKALRLGWKWVEWIWRRPRMALTVAWVHGIFQRCQPDLDEEQVEAKRKEKILKEDDVEDDGVVEAKEIDSLDRENICRTMRSRHVTVTSTPKTMAHRRKRRSCTHSPTTRKFLVLLSRPTFLSLTFPVLKTQGVCSAVAKCHEASTWRIGNISDI